MSKMLKQRLAHLSQSIPPPHIQRLIALLAVGWITLLLCARLLIPSALAHAAAGPETCASTHGTIVANCEKQGPTVQHCDADAYSRTILPVFFQQVLIGEVDLRYSPTCTSSWIRTIAYGSAVKNTSQGPVINVEANIPFPDQTQDNADNRHPQFDGSLLTWTLMTHGTPPQGASGIFDLSNGQSITMTIP